MTTNDISMHTFLFRKLHSLFGLLPAGIFLFFHFTAIGLNIFKTNPGTVLLVFWLPFLYHMLYGLRIIAHGGIGEPESYARLSLVYWLQVGAQYRYYRNYLYLLQRISASAILAFVTLHLLSLYRYPHWLAARWYQTAFAAGIVAAAFHCSNGLFGFLSNWGVITGEQAHKRVLVITAMLFVVLCLMGMSNLSRLYW